MRDWIEKDAGLEKTFVFDTFAAAIAFVNDVARLASLAEHHPDITITYNKVRIFLTTHDQGKVTQKDTMLAEQIDHI